MKQSEDQLCVHLIVLPLPLFYLPRSLSLSLSQFNSIHFRALLAWVVFTMVFGIYNGIYNGAVMAHCGISQSRYWRLSKLWICVI